MQINTRPISPDAPPYVIAEIGVNHDGDAGRALSLIDACADAGADAVKFQFFKADLLMSRAAKLASYQAAAGESDPLDMLRRLELSDADLARCADHARRRGIHAIVTVFSLPLVSIARAQPWHAFKTASPDIVHKPLLDALMADGRPMIVSTGAATIDEITRAAAWLAPARDRLAVLQCVSSYPTPIDKAELGGIIALRESLSLPTGYSDHTAETDTGMLAAALGACILEKHVTHSRAAKGPDHAASLEPDQLKHYIALARQGHAMLRNNTITPEIRRRLPAPPYAKRLLDLERDVRAVSRQSIVAARRIEAGQVITMADLAFKRPGTGIEPWRAGEFIGATAPSPLAADQPIPPMTLTPAPANR